MREDRLVSYPVFVKWYKLQNYIIDRVEKYPKSVRFTLSDRIITLAFDVTEKIIEAIYTKQRSYILRDANLYIEKLRIYIRLSSDRKYISLKQYKYLSEQIDEVGRMIGGWIK